MDTIKLLTVYLSHEVDIDELAKDILENKIDVVCMQNFPIEGIKQDKIRRPFKARGYGCQRVDSLAIFILSSLKRLGEIPAVVFQPFFNSKTGKGLLSISFHVKEKGDVDKHLYVSNMDLEEGDTGGGIRKSQIREIDNILPKDCMVVVLGNTNIPMWQTIDPSIPETRWKDGWREYGSSTNTSTNPEGDRKDRVWYRGCECVSYSNFKIPGTERYGVEVEFII